MSEYFSYWRRSFCSGRYFLVFEARLEVGWKESSWVQCLLSSTSRVLVQPRFHQRRRAATKFLLSNGAKVHARDGNDFNFIAAGEVASMKTKNNEALYSQIMLCVSFASCAGAVASPIILQEWASKLKILMDRHVI